MHDDVPTLPEVGPFRALYAHINRIVRQMRRQRPVPSATSRPTETSVGTAHHVVVPPAVEESGSGPVWLP